MFQKEVAQRICEKKGTKAGILSVLVQAFMMQNICLR
jgi:16S rRNA (adenine1518-N6/adenine1519-N6)-dimethyltransferase